METLIKINKVKNMENLEALRELYNDIENCIQNLKSLKPGLHCAIYSTFTPHFMCWKYFDEFKNLLHITLTKKLKNK